MNENKEFITVSNFITTIIKPAFEFYNFLIIKTLTDTIKISKEDYENEKIVLKDVLNGLIITSKGKMTALFFNDITITFEK